MKQILLLLFFCIQATLLFCQNLDSCGLDSQSVLNQNEAIFLNEYFKESKGDFDFKNKRIAYATGHRGEFLNTKNSYFDEIKQRECKSELVACIISSFVQFSADEKAFSNGYDGIILFWVKGWFSNKQKQKHIKTLSSNK